MKHVLVNCCLWTSFIMIIKTKIEENVYFKNSKRFFVCLFLLTHGGSTFEKKGFVRFLDLPVSVAPRLSHTDSVLGYFEADVSMEE